MFEPYDYGGDVPHYGGDVGTHNRVCKTTGKEYPPLSMSRPDDWSERIPEWRVEMRVRYLHDILDVLDGLAAPGQCVTPNGPEYFHSELRKYFPRRDVDPFAGM